MENVLRVKVMGKKSSP